MTDSTTRDLKRYFERFDGPPTGDADAWRRRYEPLIEDVKIHHTRPNALVSVIVVAHEESEAHRACMMRVCENTGLGPDDIQLIVVDNSCSEDGLSLGQWAHVHVRMKRNVWASAGRNVGALWANAPLLSFLDDDGLIARDYLMRAMAHFKQDAAIAALRTRILPHAHPYFTTLAKHYDRGQEVIEDCLITEGSAMVRREVYMRVGGFNDAMFGHEGIELTYRIKRDDPALKVVYIPDAVMHHDYMNSWGKFVRKNTMYANLDAPTVPRSPELQRFMDAYFARRFTTSPQPLKVQLGKVALKLGRGALRLATRLRAKHIK